MQFEKKLILCSILAVAIGISTIAPLTYLMTPAAAQPSVDRPALKFDMSYAYIRNVWDNNTLTNDTYGWAFSIIFESSPNFEFTDDPVAYYETYRAELSSDGTSIGNITLSAVATTGNEPPANFTFFLDNWYIFNLESDRGPVGRTGSYNGTAQNFKNGYDDNWNLTTEQPETLTMKIYLENSIIRSVNFASTQIYANENSEPIMQIELTRYRDGYLYNTAIPQQELDQINPLFAREKL